MAIDHLAENLRLLCSYGRSTSEVCRRAGINRQQFSKYLNGHARPSLSTLRRLCDFFGVDDHEILMDSRDFRELVRVRSPRFGETKSGFEETVERLIATATTNHALMETHAGYYHTYSYPDPKRDYYYRSISRIYRKNDAWLVKSIDPNLEREFMLPSILKYTGLVLEGHNRLVVCEREQIMGRALFVTILYASEQTAPTYLSGLMTSMSPEGAHEISCVRTVWHYLGKQPDLRKALRSCGVVDMRKEALPDIVVKCTDNRLVEGEDLLSPRV